MARKKAESRMTSWEEIDAALRRMGEIDIAVQKIEGEMTLRVNEIRSEAEVKAEGLKAERKGLEEEITLFCEARKEEFAKIRSRELSFGLVAYRVITKIAIRSKAACVAAMKALHLETYLRVIEEPDKEAMEGLDDATLARVGASRKTEDKLRIEPNLERLKEVA